MPLGVATSIIVFGRGLVAGQSGLQLSRASEARVRALIDYVDENKAVFSTQRGRVVFSGGWGGAFLNTVPPPVAYREGTLMAEQARALPVGQADLAFYADSYAEIESDSTLENVLRTKEAGYFGDTRFTPADPLGIVAHAGHQDRIEYFVRKIYKVPKQSVLHITARSTGLTSDVSPEAIALSLTRLAFAGAVRPSALRRRHRLLLAVGNALLARGRWRPPDLPPVNAAQLDAQND